MVTFMCICQTRNNNTASTIKAIVKSCQLVFLESFLLTLITKLADKVCIFAWEDIGVQLGESRNNMQEITLGSLSIWKVTKTEGIQFPGEMKPNCNSDQTCSLAGSWKDRRLLRVWPQKGSAEPRFQGSQSQRWTCPTCGTESGSNLGAGAVRGWLGLVVCRQQPLLPSD